MHSHDQILIEWHPGHLADDDVQHLGDQDGTRLNRGADLLAGEAAKLHLPARGIIARALRKVTFAITLQQMAISVMSARHCAKPHPLRCEHSCTAFIDLAAEGPSVLAADSPFELSADFSTLDSSEENLPLDDLWEQT